LHPEINQSAFTLQIARAISESPFGSIVYWLAENNRFPCSLDAMNAC